MTRQISVASVVTTWFAVACFTLAQTTILVPVGSIRFSMHLMKLKTGNSRPPSHVVRPVKLEQHLQWLVVR